MVREARFSWDDLGPVDHARLPEFQDDLDVLEDRLFDDFEPPRRQGTTRKSRSKRRRVDRGARAARGLSAPPHDRAAPRHLAGADWLPERPHP